MIDKLDQNNDPAANRKESGSKVAGGRAQWGQKGSNKKEIIEKSFEEDQQ